jgi:hypothetical protein
MSSRIRCASARASSRIARFLAGLGQRGLVALLGLLQPPGRLLAVLRLLPVHLVPLLHRPHQRRHDEAPEDEQDDQEQQQLDEEGGVGNQEVAVLLGRQHSRHDQALTIVVPAISGGLTARR